MIFWRSGSANEKVRKVQLKKQARLDRAGKGERVKGLEECPTVPPWQLDYLEMFFTLNRSRKNGSMGELYPLDYSEIVSCLNENEIEGFERREFLAVIQDLDFAWRTAVSEKGGEK